MFGDTLLPQYASTPKIWNSHLKEYMRYAPDRNCDGRTDGRTEVWIVRLLYASQKSLGGLKTVLLKKVELLIATNPVCIYSTSLYKA